MNVNVKNENVNLLLCVNEEIVLPIITDAFKITQSSQKKLDRYIGSLVLAPNGKVEKIESIRRKGFLGNSFFQKIKSMLIGAYDIEIVFKVEEISISVLKQIVIKYLKNDLLSNDPYLPQKLTLEEIEKKIQSISNVKDVFVILNIPKAVDCLDIL
jgi:hypothetical protein